MFEIFQPIKCVPIISFSSLAQMYEKEYIKMFLNIKVIVIVITRYYKRVRTHIPVNAIVPA